MTTIERIRARQVTAAIRSRNVAIVGASDRSGWSQGLFRNLRASPGVESVWLVNPKTNVVHGERAVASVLDIDGSVDLACVIVAASSVLTALESVVARGIPSALVIASGFAEAGEEGARRSSELRSFADEHSLAIIGPNTAGMANVADGIWPLANSMSPPFIKGPVGIVAQSGGVASQLLRLARARGVGLSAVVGVGNEVVLDATDVIRHFLYDDGTSVVAVYLEGFRDVGAFKAVTMEAAAIGKPIVMVKVGRTSASRDLVASHTGAMVGDDRVVDIGLRELGVVRVDTLDQLIATAGLFAHGPKITGRRVGVVAASGATCAIIADRASTAGLVLPAFDAATQSELASLLPGFTSPRNPLDVTGIVVTEKSSAHGPLVAVANDPNVDVVLCQSLEPERFDADVEPLVRQRMANLANVITGANIPVVLETDISTDLSPELLSALASAGLYVSRGTELTVDAMARVAWWHEVHAGVRTPTDPAPDQSNVCEGVIAAARVWSETSALELLRAHGVPIPPIVHVTSPEAAIRAARELGYPIVVKVAADGVAHKSDIGGVELGVSGDDEVASAYSRVRDRAVRELGSSSVSGALIMPMREGGVELLVALNDARPWGTMLTIGLGGVWVELLNDTASHLLPVDRSLILEMLESLRASPLLTGGRGRQPADLEAVASAVEGVVNAAMALGASLDSLEVNPLWVHGRQVEALDALIITNE